MSQYTRDAIRRFPLRALVALAMCVAAGFAVHLRAADGSKGKLLVYDAKVAAEQGDWYFKVEFEPIMFRLVELSRLGLPLQDATVMLQREVADRLLAKPGTGDYGMLTVLIGHRASVDRVLNLPPGAFRPAPKVHSSVVRLRFHPPDPGVRDESVLAAVVGAVFSRRRKTIGNALLAYGGTTPASAAAALASVGINPIRRPETLSIAELCRVADAVLAAPPNKEEVG